MFDRTERHSTRWIAWMPLLFVSAFLYWSVALGLGGLSLMAAGTLSHSGVRTFEATAIEPVPGTVALLNDTVTLNGFSSFTRVVAAAAGAKSSGELHMIVPAREPKSGTPSYQSCCAGVKDGLRRTARLNRVVVGTVTRSIRRTP